MRMTLGARLVISCNLCFDTHSGRRIRKQDGVRGEHGQEAGPEAEVFLKWMHDDHDGP